MGIDKRVFLDVFNKLLDSLRELISAPVDVNVSENDVRKLLVFIELKLLPVIQHHSLVGITNSGPCIIWSNDSQVIGVLFCVELNNYEYTNNILLLFATNRLNIFDLVRTQQNIASLGLLKECLFANSHESPKLKAVFDVLRICANCKVF